MRYPTMKRLILFSFLALYGLSFAQKTQDADTLIWNDRRYAIVVEPYVPSVLMAFYQTTGITSPFNFWSSNNNRGHVATYELLNESIYLRNIEAKRYRTRHGNLWTESGIDTIVTPDYFEISSLDSTASFSSDIVLTDWFTGFIKLIYLPWDKNDAKSDEANGSRYLFIHNGRVLENVFISASDQVKLEKNNNDKRLQTLRDLLQRREAYIDFYSRCSMDREEVSFNGHDGLFEHKPNSLTLAMLFYNNNPFQFFANCCDGQISEGAPFGKWLISNDSLFLLQVQSHRGKDVFSFATSNLDMQKFLSRQSSFANWISGEFVIHYGSWEKSNFDIPIYTVSKTQTLRIVNGLITSSRFSPSSFDDDLVAATASAFSPCNPDAVYSVDDKQLAEAVGSYRQPKKSPSYQGGLSTFRNWFLKNPLTDERAKNRLFRVRLAFMVNCKGEVGQWQVISKGKGELYEFANIVLDLVKTMPHNWDPATDRKGNPVDCWQIMEFTVSDGILTNANYK